jgi:RNA polymerase sigma factor (sigma-70 family)
MTHEPVGVSGRYLQTLFDAGVTSGLTDGQLLERFATHDGEAAELAFAALVERHGPMVLRACRAIVRDDHEAMDAFQATFLVLVRKCRSLWVRDSLGPWLHRVACRAAGRTNADARRRRAHERLAAEMLARRASVREGDDLAAVLHEELDRLPDRFRVPIVLCDLEGSTCAQAARHLGCPVGTVASRLARGRERLRSRLAQRGVVPAVAAIGTALCSETNGAALPSALADSTVQAATGKASLAAASLANSLIGSMMMAKWISVAAVVSISTGLALGGAWALWPTARAQPPQTKTGAPRKPVDPFPFMNDKERYKDFRSAELAGVRPLIQTDLGIAFQQRLGVLYKDGTAKLWSGDRKDPIAPPLRHKGPIRGLTFFDQSNLLVSLSDDSVKVWDALTGKLRKELPGHNISPLWLSYAAAPQRFVTIDSARTSVTVWDAVTLNPMATLRLERVASVLSAGLSNDGRTAVTFTYGKEQAAELWDVAAGRSFAILRPPSPVVTDIFTDQGTGLIKSKVLKSQFEHSGHFWDVVQSLAPGNH